MLKNLKIKYITNQTHSSIRFSNFKMEKEIKYTEANPICTLKFASVKHYSNVVLKHKVKYAEPNPIYLYFKICFGETFQDLQIMLFLLISCSHSQNWHLV